VRLIQKRMNKKFIKKRLDGRDTDAETKESPSKTLIAVNATLALCLLVFIIMIYQTSIRKATTAPVFDTRAIALFSHAAVDAQSVYIWDATDDTVIYARDENTPRPLASLTKLMTMDTALSILPPDATVTINPAFLEQEGDNGLYTNETWKLSNLVNFSLVVSSNDGAEAIASVAGAFHLASPDDYTVGLADFIDDMNAKAQTLGLTTLHFKNPTGLDPVDGGDGGLGSAKDVARLMYYTLKTYPVILEDTRDTSVDIASEQYVHDAVNTDEAIPTIPGLIASKTGYTARAGGNLVVAMDAGLGRTIIISVLGSTYAGRFTDMSVLASSTLAYVQAGNL
jgi:D-alanyl-D-alanine carboxypeptidase